MLIRREFLDGIVAGRVSLVFRKWRRPSVVAGSSLRTAVGVLAIESVERVKIAEITEAEAKEAGYAGREELLAELASRAEGDVYKIRLHLAGGDPRLVLREQTSLSDEELQSLFEKLDRLDKASSMGAWTLAVLRLIQKHPKTRAAELAEMSGFPLDWLKIHVRKLKNLGLTISHHPGYELSPRGSALLEQLEAR